MTDIEIRNGTESDLPEITEIYNYYVVNTAVTFDIDRVSTAGKKAWLARFDIKGPYRLLVALLKGEVVGFASSSTFRDKPAYETSVETSVYVAHGHHRKGVGSLLYSELFESIKGEDLHRAYAGVALPNPASVALHRKFGFRSLGIYREVGRKWDRYWDVEWFEKELPHAVESSGVRDTGRTR